MNTNHFVLNLVAFHGNNCLRLVGPEVHVNKHDKSLLANDIECKQEIRLVFCKVMVCNILTI